MIFFMVPCKHVMHASFLFQMFSQIGVAIGAIALVVGCVFLVPIEGGQVTGVKGKIAFGLRTTNTVVAAVSTIQSSLFLLAASLFLSRYAWFLFKTKQGAPIAVLDASNRNLIQIARLLGNKPSANVILFSFVALLAAAVSSVENVLLQSSVTFGSAWNADTMTNQVPNTSRFDALPLVHYSSGEGGVTTQYVLPTSINSTKFVAGIAAMGDVIGACNNETLICGAAALNASAPLIRCGSGIDCVQDITLYNDFDMSCSSSGLFDVVVPYYGSAQVQGYYSYRNNWMLSSSSFDLARINVTGSRQTVTPWRYIWNLTKIDPTLSVIKYPKLPYDVTVKGVSVVCSITSAWTIRREQFNAGTLQKNIVQHYDTVGPTSNGFGYLNNYANQDLDSYLYNSDFNMTTSTETLHYIGLMLNSLDGNCTGYGGTQLLQNAQSSFLCTSAMLQSLTSAQSQSFDPVVTPLQLEQEMRFTMERIFKRLINSNMPLVDVSVPNSTLQATTWVEPVRFWTVVGIVNTMTVIFAVLSVCFVKIGKVKDESVLAAQIAQKLGSPISSDNEFKQPVVVKDVDT
ncbi:hypothetical protein BC830DRAFT_1095045 [Chytriomyces sp. MP71]|nr:hypothetical protein BC830DRAFT_1095045 [Chytriomyces sp. MP71]